MSKQESSLNELYDRVGKWYQQIHLHYLIASKSYRREFAIMSPDGKLKRNLRVHNAQGFQFIMNCWHVMRRLETDRGLERFYRSAAIYKNGLPYSNHDLSATPATNAWNSMHIDHMTGYDLFIDIDEHLRDDFDISKESMILVHESLKDSNIPHEINFSGRGFHVIVPHEFLPKKSFDPNVKDNIYAYCLKAAKKLSKDCSELIDTSVFEPRRIIKIPYTLALYGKDLYVCTPIIDETDIYNCRLEDFTPEAVDINDGFKLFYDDKKQVRIW